MSTPPATAYKYQGASVSTPPAQRRLCSPATVESRGGAAERLAWWVRRRCARVATVARCMARALRRARGDAPSADVPVARGERLVEGRRRLLLAEWRPARRPSPPRCRGGVNPVGSQRRRPQQRHRGRRTRRSRCRSAAATLRCAPVRARALRARRPAAWAVVTPRAIARWVPPFFITGNLATSQRLSRTRFALRSRLAPRAGLTLRAVACSRRALRAPAVARVRAPQPLPHPHRRAPRRFHAAAARRCTLRRPR